MKKLCLIFFSLFFSTGCVQEEILDDVSIITVAGFDQAKDEQVEGTIVIPEYLQDQPVTGRVLSDTSILSRDIITDMQKKASDPLVLGKIQMVLFGEELAKGTGINDLVDALQRDASIGSRVILAVTRGDSKSMLEGDYSNDGTATYLSNLILHNQKDRDLPKTNLHLFLHQFFSKGKDSYLPIIKVTESGKDVEIDGLAVFDKERVASELTNEQLFFFKLLTDGYTKGSYIVKMPDTKEIVSIKSIESSTKFTLVSEDPLEVLFELKVDGTIREFTGDKITQEKINKFEKHFEKIMEDRSVEMLEQFKELNIDPVGVGDQISRRSRKFKVEEWDKYKSNYSLKVKADVTISETGVID
ncbi:Ger(x)C family spore germination protein [Metabacillus herbersteinensis]|uniref:Ger(X)C family spore germination protein n=1 Tax=Metabacillus herbersteinensis TaxID=283816 RepID=A0ABV6GAD8_9BACI